jgi:hypothetical protein
LPAIALAKVLGLVWSNFWSLSTVAWGPVWPAAGAVAAPTIARTNILETMLHRAIDMLIRPPRMNTTLGKMMVDASVESLM